MKGSPLAAVLAAVFLLLGIDASAEKIRVRVTDRDLGIPLEGVALQETNSGARAVTDAGGNATIETGAAPFGRGLVVAQLVGYETSRAIVKDPRKQVELKMVIEGVLEADELVVEERAIGASDEALGVSVVAEKEMVKTTAMIGLMEDVMNTVRILPGVSYSGSFNSYLSVRGGEPDGLTHVMDGFVIKYPYHWGGAVSIFNPHLVDSVKLSAGIFPVKYGQATSGLLEINTVKPNQGLRWEFAQSISTMDGFVQIPLAEDDETAGFFAGCRLTKYDLVFALTGKLLEDQGVTFSRYPYIYDFYFKTFWRPTPGLEWYVNSFVGQDGIGIKALDPDADLSKEISNTFDFKYSNQDVFVNTGLKWLAGDKLFVSFLGGYERWTSNVDGSFTEIGTRAYSEEFLNEYGALLGLSSGDTFSVDAESKFRSTNTLHHFQFRGDADWQAADNYSLETGAGFFLGMMRYDQGGTFWSIVFEADGTPAYKKIVYSIAAEDNDVLTSFAYLSLRAKLIPDRLEGDLGLRVDHGYFMGEGFTLNTKPVLGPRVLLKYMPELEGGGFLEKSAFSLGTGIFSKVPFESLFLTKDMGLEDYDVKVPKTFMTVGGWEGVFPLGWRFKIEGYYKYVYDRFYYNLVTVADAGGEQEKEVRVHNDGTGHVAGFDILLDRKTSRFIDGMLSYSFIWARYLNPESDGSTDNSAGDDESSDPRGKWYYPSFHRFHSLNLLVNVKPAEKVTWTTKLSFATGTPLPRYGDRQMFFAKFENKDGSQSIAEMYTRRTYYDDYNRRGWVLPLDMKLSFHFYTEGGKVYHEIYVGAEDLLSPLLAKFGPSSGEVRTDQYTGKDTSAASEGFSFPIVSLGYRASY